MSFEYHFDKKRTLKKKYFFFFLFKSKINQNINILQKSNVYISRSFDSS